MKFLFFAPLRTNLNLDSIAALKQPESLRRLITEVIEARGQTNTECEWQCLLENCDASLLRYETLAQDSTPASALPFLKLTVPEHIVHQLMPELSSPNSTAGVRFDDCAVFYYDNTMGVIKLALSLEEVTDRAALLGGIDEWSIRLCKAVATFILPEESGFRSALIEAQNTKDLRHFLRRNEFEVFFDRHLQQGQAPPVVRDDIMWVNRLLILGKGDPNECHVRQWLQQSDPLARAREIGSSRLIIRAGNSVCLSEMGREDIEAYERVILQCSYFFALFDSINRNLRQIYLDNADRKNLSTKTIHSVSRTRGHIQFLHNELVDSIMGLQGSRRELAELLLSTWGFQGLIEAVQKKNEVAGGMIEYFLEKRSIRYNRMVETILAAIGGFSVLGFAVSLFSFARSDLNRPESVPGLVHLAQHAPIDLVLYIVIGILSILLIPVMRRR